MRIDIRPSRQLAVLLGLSHVAAAWACLIVDMPGLPRLVLLLGVGLSLAHTLYGPALLRAMDAIVAVELGEGGSLAVQTRRGDWRAAALCDSSFVAPYLAVLNLKVEKGYFARHVVILPDSMDPDDFRRLRIWLRWRKPAAV